MNKRLVVTVLTTLAAGYASQALANEPQPGLEWAVGYEQPSHKCKRPKMKQSNEVAGKIARYERKMARFAKCVQKHQRVLIADHKRLVEAGQGSISQEQAGVLAQKLKGIEATITELGQDSNIGLDPKEVDRIVRVGNRPSI